MLFYLDYLAYIWRILSFFLIFVLREKGQKLFSTKIKNVRIQIVPSELLICSKFYKITFGTVNFCHLQERLLSYSNLLVKLNFTSTLGKYLDTSVLVKCIFPYSLILYASFLHLNLLTQKCLCSLIMAGFDFPTKQKTSFRLNPYQCNVMLYLKSTKKLQTEQTFFNN